MTDEVSFRLGPFAVHEDGSTPCTFVTQPEGAIISIEPADVSDETYYCEGVAQAAALPTQGNAGMGACPPGYTPVAGSHGIIDLCVKSASMTE